MSEKNEKNEKKLKVKKSLDENKTAFFNAVNSQQIEIIKNIRIESVNIFIVKEKNKDYEDIYIEGLKLNRIDDLDVIMTDYKIIDCDDNMRDGLEKSGYIIENVDKLFAVSFLTSDNLRRYIYEEQLNLFTYFFKEEKTALMFLSIFERILYAKKHNKIISETIKLFK